MNRYNGAAWRVVLTGTGLKVLQKLTSHLQNMTNRDRVGIAAVVLLVITGVIYGLHYFAFIESLKPSAPFMRIGLPLFFLWLAWPDLAAFPKWVFHASVPTVILVAIYPKLLCFIVPVVMLMMFLQPKQAKKKK